jgi:hypothetical protein
MTAAPVQLFAMGERGSCLQIPKNHAPRASLRPAHSANAASSVVLASTPEIHAQSIMVGGKFDEPRVKEMLTVDAKRLGAGDCTLKSK